MKNLRPIKTLMVSLLLVLTIIVFLCPNMSKATETDSYTYAYIELEDSALKLNYKLNELFDLIFTRVNDLILSGKKLSDTQVEFYFSYYYYNEIFDKDPSKDVFSVFETCIDSNQCKNWPYFERIFLLPHESIYYESNYSSISKKYLSSNIQVCGVRIGTDKISHFIKDGFQLYNATKDANYKLTDKDIIKYASIYESTVMGSTFTGVYSYADLRASYEGAQFFKDLFTKHLTRDKNGLIKFKSLNFCDYIDQKYDERILKNVYTEGASERARIEKVIEKRLNDKSQPMTRAVILARKPTIEQVTLMERAIATFKILTPKLLSPEVRKALSILDIAPNGIDRVKTEIPKGG